MPPDTPGLLERIVGSYDPSTKDEYGMTSAERRAPIFQGLLNTGAKLVAGGGNIMPADRSRYLAGALQQMGGIPQGLMEARAQGAQNVLRMQQVKKSQSDLAQEERWR